MKEATEDSTKVWVLVDNRIGNANQATELAESLEEKYEIKHIEYNYFARLPNFLLSLFPICVKRSILNNLKEETIPDIIISSGRRTASLALYLKKRSQGRAKLIQIMRPDINPTEFEIIILPQHDKFNYSLPNVVRTIGALTNVKNKIAQKYEGFNEAYPNIDRYIAVIIGGSTKNYTFTLEKAQILENRLLSISNEHSLPLFISFSRRTPKNIKKHFKKSFTWPNIIYDPEDDGINPYPAMLQQAEFVIITTDSISMCSEAASIGKPLYVFSLLGFNSQKHNFFIQQLVDLGIAKRLENNTSYLEKYTYKPLSEITRVADIIKKKLLN
ncbi:MAG: ELM1/GtrOC1 family putative glycosyltransferase [Rickettsiaceae bacterium]|nr:ELM1/GtrOC1 family putative glycosyltransferase [Rickettsiaceae bacterium]